MNQAILATTGLDSLLEVLPAQSGTGRLRTLVTQVASCA